VQEALTNVVRHRGAKATVSVHAYQAGITIEVTDDGPGPGDRSRRGYGRVQAAVLAYETGLVRHEG